MSTDDRTNEALTAQEREALAALPREHQPSPGLEEATVATLAARGLLRPRREATRRGLFLSGGSLAVAAVVTCVAVIGAFAVGHNRGASEATGAMLAMHEQDTALATASIQQTAAAYQAALAQLAGAAGGGVRPQNADFEADREVAIAALYQVADQMTRLAPDDPLTARILQAFEQADAPFAGQATADNDQQIVWF